MKLAVAVPAGLVLGLALGTVAGKMMHKAPPAAEAGADSTSAAAPEGARAAEPAPDSAAQHSPPSDSGTAPVATPAATPAPGAAETQRLAKMLDRLPAADAVALVTAWSDAELEAVLRAMDVAKSADLIAALPKPRAAVLSRKLLAPAGAP